MSIEPKTIPKPTISCQANSDLFAKVKSSELPAIIWSVSTITESVEVQKLTSEISSIKRTNERKIKRVLPNLINCAKLNQLTFETRKYFLASLVMSRLQALNSQHAFLNFIDQCFFDY